MEFSVKVYTILHQPKKEKPHLSPQTHPSYPSQFVLVTCMILASAKTNFHWKKKKKRIETSKMYLQIKIYKCCQICFFFLFVRERNTFMISTAWHIKPCNIQRFIEDTGDLFFGWGVFRQTGQRDPVTLNAWQGFCCLLRGKLCMIIKIK